MNEYGAPEKKDRHADVSAVVLAVLAFEMPLENVPTV
jgi:hypothetical protein